MPFDRGNDLAYTTIIQIGTPPRNFTVMLDAGSADFWVGAEDCRSEDGGSCVSVVYPTTIYSDTVLPPRVITLSSAGRVHPLSKTPERTGIF